MEKYPESIADLEQCVTASANEQALHMALSMAYDKTGDQKKADLHRSESERLLKASGRKVASKQDDTTKEEASKEKVKS